MVCMFLKSTGKTKFTTALPTSEPSQLSTIPAKKTVETNIFDFNKDVYGEEMVVELLHYHRKETRFSSVEALQAQLFQDIEFGKQYVTNVLSH